MMLESYFLGQQVCESVFCLRWCGSRRRELAESSVGTGKKDRRGRDKEEDEIEGWEGELPSIHNLLSRVRLVKGS